MWSSPGECAMTRLRRFLRERPDKERGAVAVELALLTPLLAALLLGILEFGTIMNTQQGLEAASRDGARYATIEAGVPKADILTRTTNAFEGTNATASVEPDVDFPCAGREGEHVTVTISVPEEIEVLFIGVTQTTLEASSVFACVDGT